MRFAFHLSLDGGAQLKAYQFVSNNAYQSCHIKQNDYYCNPPPPLISFCGNPLDRSSWRARKPGVDSHQRERNVYFAGESQTHETDNPCH